MKETQPSITSDQELAGYRASLAQLEGIMRGYETTVGDPATDADWREYTRTKLYRVYAIRKGILDAIAVYLKQQRQTA
jgi:hypothetical protein